MENAITVAVLSTTPCR